MHRLISKREAADYVRVHPEHLMRLSRAGKFPRAIKLGSGQNCAVRFVVDEIEEWLAQKLSERDAKREPHD